MIECEWPECVTAGQHVAGCEDEGCAGCRGRPVERGRLCARHWAWLNRDLAGCAELVLQVRSAVIPGPAGRDDRVSGGRLVPPAPGDLGAVDAADELFALLVSAGAAMAEQLSRPTPPLPSRVWRAGAVVHGLPSLLSPEAAAAAVAGVVRWWRDLLEELAGLPDIADVAPELHDLVGRIRRRWPEAERARHLPGTPCRDCDLMDLWWTPPPEERWPITVECHSCGYVAPESDLSRLTRLVEFEQRERRTAGLDSAVPRRSWLTVDQAISELRISRATLWRWRQKYVIREARLTKRHPIALSREDLLEAARAARGGVR